jgi:hypothetical protein
MHLYQYTYDYLSGTNKNNYNKMQLYIHTTLQLSRRREIRYAQGKDGRIPVVTSSETSVNIHQTTDGYIPEEGHLNTLTMTDTRVLRRMEKNP